MIRQNLAGALYLAATRAERLGRGVSREGPIVVWPPIVDRHELRDLIPRLEWAIPSLTPRRELVVPIDPALAAIDVDTEPPAPYLRRYPAVRLPLRLSADRGECRRLLRESSLVVVWRTSAMMRPPLLSTWGRCALIDRHFYGPIQYYLGWGRVKEATCDPAFIEVLQRESHDNFLRLLQLAPPGGVINLLGKGPGIRATEAADLTGDLNIVCNSMVRSRTLLARLRPRVIVFGDVAFYCGPSCYSAQFREDLVAAARTHDAFVVVPGEVVHLIAGHFPELRPNLIGLSAAPALTIPSPEHLYVRARNNVLTYLLLPMALALKPRLVQLWGFDGRPPEDVAQQKRLHVWERDPTLEYDELMPTMRAAHPSLFRDLPDDEYYEKHLRRLDECLAFADRQGVPIRTCSPSFIPALAARAAAPEARVVVSL
jgi:hypothetical protein